MSRSDLTWVRLHLPVPLHPDAAESAVRALAGISGAPQIVLEAIGRSGAVSWRLGTDRDRMARVIETIRPHLGGLRVDQADARDTPPTPTVAAGLNIRGHRQTSLDVGRREPVARSVLAALACARADESVRRVSPIAWWHS